MCFISNTPGRNCTHITWFVAKRRICWTTGAYFRSHNDTNKQISAAFGIPTSNKAIANNINIMDAVGIEPTHACAPLVLQTSCRPTGVTSFAGFL